MTRINDNGVERDMTAAELEAYEKAAAEIMAVTEAQAAEFAAKQAAATSARAKLQKLGLTDDEIAAITGA